MTALRKQQNVACVTQLQDKIITQMNNERNQSVIRTETNDFQLNLILEHFSLTVRISSSLHSFLRLSLDESIRNCRKFKDMDKRPNEQVYEQDTQQRWMDTKLIAYKIFVVKSVVAKT